MTLMQCRRGPEKGDPGEMQGASEGGRGPEEELPRREDGKESIV